MFIVVYRGVTMFPTWITTVTLLEVVRFDKFNNLEKLPPLGKLPVSLVTHSTVFPN